MKQYYFFSTEHPVLKSEKELLTECRFERLRRSGPGGQHRNKVETAVRFLHLPTGLIGEASERRSQLENRKEAFHRLRINFAIFIRTPSVFVALPDISSKKEMSDKNLPDIGLINKKLLENELPEIGLTDKKHSNNERSKIARAKTKQSEKGYKTNPTTELYLDKSGEQSDFWKSWILYCPNGKIRLNSGHFDFPILLAFLLNELWTAEFDLSLVSKRLLTTSSQILRFLNQEPKAFSELTVQRQARHLPRLY